MLERKQHEAYLKRNQILVLLKRVTSYVSLTSTFRWTIQYNEQFSRAVDTLNVTVQVMGSVMQWTVHPDAPCSHEGDFRFDSRLKHALCRAKFIIKRDYQAFQRTRYLTLRSSGDCATARQSLLVVSAHDWCVKYITLREHISTIWAFIRLPGELSANGKNNSINRIWKKAWNGL